MTRGRAYLITTDKKILCSTEFNGDMYPEGHGRTFLNVLNEVDSEEDFERFVFEFNRDNHNYEDEQLVFTETGFDVDGLSQAINWLKMTIAMTNKNYFELFFSDWTFWKNISNETVKIKTRDKKTITLKPGQAVAIKYGVSKDCYRPYMKEVNLERTHR